MSHIVTYHAVDRQAAFAVASERLPRVDWKPLGDSGGEGSPRVAALALAAGATGDSTDRAALIYQGWLGPKLILLAIGPDGDYAVAWPE